MASSTGSPRAGPPPAAAELEAGVAWLIRLRWVAVVGVAVFLEVARQVFPLTIDTRPLFATLVALAGFNVLWVVVLRRLRKPRSEGVQPRVRAAGLLLRLLLGPHEIDRRMRDAALFANVQIAVDLLLLATLLHFAGGIENPFIVFFIFHVIVAAILLSRVATYLHATIGLLLVSGIAIAEMTGAMQHYPLGGTWGPDGFRNIPLVVAQLFVLGATLYLSAYMGTTIAGRLRRREHEGRVLARELAAQADYLERICSRLERSEQARSRYLREVAQELRGPLGTIRKSLGAILGDTLPPSSLDLLGRGERRVGELTHVTEELLALARARDVAAETVLVAVQLGTIVREIVEASRPRADRAGIALEATIDEPGRQYRADPQGIEQLVRHLLANAIGYTPPGGRVEVRLAATRVGVRLEVADTGIGIPEDALSHVFEEFFRAENARQLVPEGGGLGLAVVKAVAGQHGGFVTVASEPNRGSTFTVELPLEPVT